MENTDKSAHEIIKTGSARIIINIEDAQKKCAENIKKIRMREGLTQREMMRRLRELGVDIKSQSVISAYESGERMPPFEMLIAYANYAATSGDAVLGRANLDDVPIEDLITDAELLEMIHRASADTLARMKGIFRYLLLYDDDEIVDPALFKEYQDLSDSNAIDRLEALVERLEKRLAR